MFDLGAYLANIRWCSEKVMKRNTLGSGFCYALLFQILDKNDYFYSAI